jgi:hypothetical protein
MRTLSRLLTLLMMLTLSFQGLAAALAPVHKAVNGAQAALPPCHEQAAAADHQSGNRHDGGVAHDGDAVNHGCCHQVLSCAPCATLLAGAHKFSDVPHAVRTLATLYIPDSPDRPPRG